ncbi:hypothetical protein AOQ84DRAFT_367424 [Glonium stellatum]|uniref:Uncharacterized protein n=1 Tax=Glonium stellatum TaxID=574774 RepID=A0A8E2ETS4_9PEZI|nr:hypothetical protein AOQ84DRAFT_367424 [Glonium stellatum]
MDPTLALFVIALVTCVLTTIRSYLAATRKLDNIGKPGGSIFPRHWRFVYIGGHLVCFGAIIAAGVLSTHRRPTEWTHNRFTKASLILLMCSLLLLNALKATLCATSTITCLLENLRLFEFISTGNIDKNIQHTHVNTCFYPHSLNARVDGNMEHKFGFGETPGSMGRNVVVAKSWTPGKQSGHKSLPNRDSLDLGYTCE